MQQQPNEYIQEGRKLTDKDGVYHRHNNWGGRYRDIRGNLEEILDFSGYDELNIVDLGTSKGKAIDKMAEHLSEDYDTEFTTYAIDVSPEHVEKALGQENVDAAATGRIEQIPFTDSSFEVVVCNGLLPYISQDPEEYDFYDDNPHYRAFSEINRILTEDGAAAVETVNRMPYEEQFIFEQEDIEQLLENNQPDQRILFNSGEHIEFHP